MKRTQNRFLNVLALLLLLALASCSTSRTAPASENKSSENKPSENKSSENQSLAPAAENQSPLPQPQGFVNDFAGKLSPDVKQKLETRLEKFANQGNIELAVVTIPFDEMKGEAIEDYSLRLATQWGIGRGPQKSGLLLLVAIKPPGDDGVYHGGTRLEVSRSLEADMPNELAAEIIGKMRDDFASGKFDQALTLGAQSIITTLAEKRGISLKE